ncbi:HEPN domain-containing protein [Infirmifilum lucidum]|uniref:HEPN domain-containing protein n=1 Tax=Infirmifilum lucidum TaxID=2776706 RepID=A0A7L9FGM9_9CREN|nr:HEPN domain-containing protein [Infirmifilum lucidum]QOJ78867.1 HEPN domain-containing protein [Infirmifilum lucidum]
MSFYEAEVLRERANEFLIAAEDLFSKGFYDLAAFSVEQYCQLIVKYKLLVKVGYYPRTHSLVSLIRELSKVAPQVKVLLEEDEVIIARIEDAYIGSRYLPRRYSRREVEDMLKFVKDKFRRVVESV